MSAKLLFSASKNKYQMKKYHQACAGKKNLLVVVKGLNDKIFGGFWANELPKMTPQNMNSFGGNMVDISPKSFIFSLNNKDKFTLISDVNVIQNYDQSEGPNFGNDCIGIYRRIPAKFRKMPNENNPVGPFGRFGGFGGGLGGGFGGFGAN